MKSRQSHIRKERNLFRAKGWSMFPSIWPYARLQVEPFSDKSVRVGDVIGFIGEEKRMVAHRVVRIEQVGEEEMYFTKGDTQMNLESVPRSAITCVVIRIWHGPFSYSTRGVVGRIIAQRSLHAFRAERFLVVKIRRLLIRSMKQYRKIFA